MGEQELREGSSRLYREYRDAHRAAARAAQREAADRCRHEVRTLHAVIVAWMSLLDEQSLAVAALPREQEDPFVCFEPEQCFHLIGGYELTEWRGSDGSFSLKEYRTAHLDELDQHLLTLMRDTCRALSGPGTDAQIPWLTEEDLRSRLWPAGTAVEDSPAQEPYTVTVAGPERHDGEKPYTYVLSAPDMSTAQRRALSYHRAQQGDEDLLIVQDPRDTFPGIPSWPQDTEGLAWTDLRDRRIPEGDGS